MLFGALGGWAQFPWAGQISSGGAVFAVLNAAGAGTLSATSGPASGALSAAGLGALSAVSGPAAGALSSSGAGTLSGNLAAKGITVLNAAGAGAVAATIFSHNFSSMAGAGSGALVTGQAIQSYAVATAQGAGALGGAEAPDSSSASLAGAGGFVGVIYAFFADAEKAAPLNEVRVAYAPVDPSRWRVEPPAYAQPEPRMAKVTTKRELPAVVPFENRVYDVAGKQRTAKPPNRRRTL